MPSFSMNMLLFIHLPYMHCRGLQYSIVKLSCSLQGSHIGILRSVAILAHSPFVQYRSLGNISLKRCLQPHRHPRPPPFHIARIILYTYGLGFLSRVGSLFPSVLVSLPVTLSVEVSDSLFFATIRAQASPALRVFAPYPNGQ